MKIVLFDNTGWHLNNPRLPLAEKLVKIGYNVLLVSPSGDYSDRTRKAGYDWCCLELSHKGINPFLEVRSIIQLIFIPYDFICLIPDKYCS